MPLADRTLDLLRHLATKPGHDEVKADFRELLVEEFGAARGDLDSPDTGRKLVFAGGFAGTEGMIHTGIGPFDIDRGTFLAYGKASSFVPLS